MTRHRTTRPFQTRKGAHGTLYRFRVVYRDAHDEACPDFDWFTWAYSVEHAEEKFLDSDHDGWGDHDGWKMLSHTVSELGLVGGGERARPGEVTLAHHGVLFLDELTEFRRSAIESLAFALSRGYKTIARAGSIRSFPARPKLVVAASNPCPCGHAGTAHPCRCSADAKKSYETRLADLAARLGLVRVDVPRLTLEDMTEGVGA